MKTKIEEYKLTPVDNTYRNPVRVVKVGTHNDPATPNDIKKLQEFLDTFNKHLIIEYIEEGEIERTTFREYDE